MHEFLIFEVLDEPRVARQTICFGDYLPQVVCLGMCVRMSKGRATWQLRPYILLAV